jgi:1-acyl-sn-glycerol-3-phosphate acyltransferase
MSAFYDAHRIPLRVLFRAVSRTRARNMARIPARGGVVVVSNHLSMLDPLLLGMLFPRQLHFMAKEELFRFKPLGWYLRQGGTFAVRRGETDRGAIRQAESLLRDGEMVMIFPEGHRSETGGIVAARAGAVMLAARTNSQILPVAISGTEKLRLKQLPGQSYLNMLRRPRIEVAVGEPITVDPSGRGAARRKAAEEVMRSIVTLLPPQYHGVFGADGMPEI